MSDDLQTLDSEIHRLRQEAAAVERTGPTFDERWPTVEAELLEAEASFRRLGPQLSGFVSALPEHVEEGRRAMVGACMVANGMALLDSERARVRAATQDGVSAGDKARKINELRAAILRTAAKRELLLREREAPGESLPRDVHPELVIMLQATVERLAAR